jgi:hypothetical protein
MKRIFYWFNRWFFRVIAYLSRRFTPAGYFLLALLVSAAIFGADTTLAMVFQIFTFVACLLLLAFLLSLRMRARFDVERKLPRFVTAGRTFTYDVRIKNPLNRSCIDLYIIDEFEQSRLSYQEFSRATTDAQLRKMPVTQRLGPSLWSTLFARKQGAQIEPAMTVNLQPNESKQRKQKCAPADAAGTPRPNPARRDHGCAFRPPRTLLFPQVHAPAAVNFGASQTLCPVSGSSSRQPAASTIRAASP